MPNPISKVLFPSHIRGNIEDLLASIGVTLQIVSNTILVTFKTKVDGEFKCAKEMSIPNDIYGISYSVIVSRLFEMFKSQIDVNNTPTSIGFRNWYRSHRHNGIVLGAWRDRIVSDAVKLGLEGTASGVEELERLYNAVCIEKVANVSKPNRGVLEEITIEDFLKERRPCRIKKTIVADVVVKTIDDYLVNESGDYYLIDPKDSGNFPWLSDFDFTVEDLGKEAQAKTKDEGKTSSGFFVDNEVKLFDKLWHQPPEENVTVKISHSKRALLSPSKHIGEEGSKIEEVIYRYLDLFREHKLDVSPAKFLISRRGSFVYHRGILRLKPVAVTFGGVHTLGSDEGN